MKFKICLLFLKRFLNKIGCTSAKISSKLGFLHSVCTIFGCEEGVLRATRPMKGQKAVKKKGED